jgi:hypothetical protein
LLAEVTWTDYVFYVASNDTDIWNRVAARKYGAPRLEVSSGKTPGADVVLAVSQSGTTAVYPTFFTCAYLTLLSTFSRRTTFEVIIIIMKLFY